MTFGKKICQWCKQHEAAQRGEDPQYQRVETAPWAQRDASVMLATQLLIGANAIVFLKMTLAAGLTLFGSQEWNSLDVMRIGANVGIYTLSGQWWRLLTNTFIHGGLLHFAFNMWCLWSLGRLAEAVYGHWTFTTVYLLCGLSGSLGTVFHNPLVSSVGASGAIFGIAGALISSFYLGEFSLPRSAISSMLRSVVAFVGYNLVFGAMIAHVDNAAHIGGLIMGLILGALIAKTAPAQDAILQRIAVLLLGAALVAGGAFWLSRSRAYVVHRESGLSHLNAGDPDAAIRELEKSVRQKPNSVDTHEALAEAYFNKRDFDHAAAEIRRAIALDPRNETAQYNLGLINMEQRQPDKAEAAFTQLLKLNPNSANGHAGMGRVLTYRGHYAEALAEYETVARIDSLYPNVYYLIGVLAARLNRPDDAIAALLKQRQNWDSTATESVLADLYDATGRKREADAARAKAAELSEKN